MAKVKELGELGVPAVHQEVRFTWFGRPMRVHPAATELVLVEFAEESESIQIPDGVDLSDPESIAALSEEEQADLVLKLRSALPMVKNYLRRCVHPDDFTAFWELGLDNGYNSQRFLGVANVLLDKAAQAATARPTRPLRNSGVTRRRTKGKSGGGSSSRATGWMEQGAARVIRRHEKSGRPDLAEIHQQRQEFLLESR